MAVPQPASSKAAFGGRKQGGIFRDLADALRSQGVDTSVDPVQVMGNDAHSWYNQRYTNAESITAELAKIGQMNPKPSRFIYVGDILTELATAFGFGPSLTAGQTEAVGANVMMGEMAACAQAFTFITGNHDTYPNENPVGAFMAANCPTYWSGQNHSWVCGGVHCIALSASHDARLVQGQSDYLATVLEAIEDDADVVIFVHQPTWGSRVAETGIRKGIMAAVPSGFSNPLWLIGGHNHVCNETKYQLPAPANTTLVQWELPATSPIASSADNTRPGLAAMACKDGRVHSRYIYDGKSQTWTVLVPSNRTTGLNATPDWIDGLAPLGLTALTTFEEGEYSRTGKIITPQNSGWRDTGSWLSYVTTIQTAFPQPVGATRFFVSITGTPVNPQMSADGTTWTNVSVPSDSVSLRVFTIPTELQSAPTLHFKMTCDNPFIGGWGFA